MNPFLRFLENMGSSKRKAEHFLRHNRLAERWAGLFAPSSLDDPWENQWRIPLSLAVSIHIITFALTLLPPSLFQGRYKIPEYYTVDLFNATEVPRPPAKVVKIAPAKAKKKVASIPKPPPAKAVSISPFKIKPKKTKDKEKLKQEELIRQRLEHIEAKLKEQKAMEKARNVAQDAVAKIKDLYQMEQATEEVAVQANATSEQTGAYSDLSESEKRYWATVTTHIQSFWTLPDLQNWEENLEAVYVIKVQKNGTMTKGYFEKKSKNYYFNQFVERTVQNSIPLPPFPPDMKKTNLEIGLIFHPGGLW